MPKESSGIILYRFKEGQLQVLLVHPGGPFWKGKDKGAWSIPKGEVLPGEDPLEAAIRELQEETGARPKGRLTELHPVKQKGGKKVFAWAAEGQWEPSTLKSNTFRLEWPPGSGNYREFPEVDGAGWFSMKEARERILPSQLPLLDELETLCSKQKESKGNDEAVSSSKEQKSQT